MFIRKSTFVAVALIASSLLAGLSSAHSFANECKPHYNEAWGKVQEILNGRHNPVAMGGGAVVVIGGVIVTSVGAAVGLPIIAAAAIGEGAYFGYYKAIDMKIQNSLWLFIEAQRALDWKMEKAELLRDRQIHKQLYKAFKKVQKVQKVKKDVTVAELAQAIVRGEHEGTFCPLKEGKTAKRELWSRNQIAEWFLSSK